MRCPYCRSEEDRVVDSRVAERGRAIRRRRECLGCGRRFTTFERVEETPPTVVKRDGSEEPFARSKMVEGIRRAVKNRPVTPEQIDALADEVEDAVRLDGRRRIPSSEIGREVLDRLRALDDVAYLRFASVYKGFQELTDFERELLSLVQGRGARGDDA
ncbi:MAG TPA: transcriptional regulator NrdR [Actinomycetota bacterium]|nr:transcriptional regulator NrdR [Actinomycetota bacterium]